MPGKTSGISYKRGRCGGCQCVMFQVCRRVWFCDWLSGLDTLYVGDTDLCIDHLQHTEVEDNVEEMDAFEEYGALLITVVMQMQPFMDDIF